jgi:ssDNA-binding Zn-finger/Zn-ribbon topoisomerase 1
VIGPANGMNKSKRQIAFNKISAKHFDFVLCDKKNLSVVCAIELDDKSHLQKKTIARDKLVNSACNTAGLPLVRFKAKATYKRNEIEETLSQFVTTSMRETAEHQKIIAPKIDPEVKTANAETQSCPKCNEDLVLRMAKKGKHTGKEFMACSSYPKCKYVEKSLATTR